MCVHVCVFEVRFQRKMCNMRRVNWTKREEFLTCGEVMVDVFWAFNVSFSHNDSKHIRR